MTTTASPPHSEKFEAPHPGSQAMPRWDTGELIEAPVFTWRNLLAMLGPGLVMGASAIGGGEWLAGPAVTAKYGGALLWVATLSIIFQVIYNIEISRYALYTGEPIFTGKFRIPPHPMFWLVVYLLLDWGSIFPYLVTSAAIPLEAIWLAWLKNWPSLVNYLGISPESVAVDLPQHDTFAWHWWMHKWTCTGLYLILLVPLIFGGKIYNSLKIVMGVKLVLVIGFLLFLGVFFARPSSWVDIISGLFQVGTVPVVKGEDLNGNGVLDQGEDFDRDGRLDGVEEVLERDKVGRIKRFDDADGDGTYDGTNVENVFVNLWQGRSLPKVDFSLIAMIAALAAIAGNGGLTNTPISNFTRDQGWGMGHKVGAIPSVVGGKGITLSHVGCVFEVNEQTLPRWRRWVRHISRDQLVVWMGACLIGVSLPSILSVEFLKRGTNASDWNLAALTAGGVQAHVTEPRAGVLAHSEPLKSLISGPGWGKTMWVLTLFCGFLVLVTSQTTTVDGVCRRWVDVTWTALPALRQLPTYYIKYVYFTALCTLTVLAVTIMWVTDKPGTVFKIATTGYNFALAFSAWHTIAVNSILLPKELRPGWFKRIGLLFAGCFFLTLGVLAAIQLWRELS